MESRKLGTSGPEVSTLGYGCMGLSFPNAPAKEESIRLLSFAWRLFCCSISGIYKVMCFEVPNKKIEIR